MFAVPMSHFFKHIIALLTLGMFLFFSSGIIIEISHCDSSGNSCINVFGLDHCQNSKNAQCHNIETYQKKTCCASNKYERTSCHKSLSHKCCKKEIQYLKKDANFTIVSPYKVIKPIVPVVEMVYPENEAKSGILFNLYTEEIEPDIKIPIQKILLFYHHHNSSYDEVAHSYTS